MLIVLTQNDSEVIDSILQATLLASDATKLKMRIRFVAVDRNRLLEARDRLGILPARLKDQPQLIVCARISRIYCCRFH